MIKTIIGSLTLGMLFAAQANATSLTLTGPDSVTIGNSLVLEIIGNFGDEGLYAGGITLDFDESALSLTSIVLNPELNSQFSCPGFFTCPENAVVLGSTDVVAPFEGLIAPGAGDMLLATLIFDTNSPSTEGTSTFIGMSDFSSFAGGWFAFDLSDGSTPDLIGKSVTLNAIPLPAAAWLMIGGLATLMGFRRK
ncbi:MAG: VPLPA-CTERM sorting domain-containing protein [Gammaproteobacteria bacterium]|nr:VPLPA-CTERM sorting domain-containing protein [Gammaproteobacteria bacterium]